MQLSACRTRSVQVQTYTTFDLLQCCTNAQNVMVFSAVDPSIHQHVGLESESEIPPSAYCIKEALCLVISVSRVLLVREFMKRNNMQRGCSLLHN